MINYLLYRFGLFIALRLPLKGSYAIACAIADAYSFLAKAERLAVKNNLKAILDGENLSEEEIERMAREVFRNFAKYLVDFFRFSTIDQIYIKRFVKIEGLENIEQGLSKGKGVIVLSAHIGNWELGGCVLPRLGYPTSAVVLTHQNKRINNFFTHQRSLSRLKPIEIGISLRACYNALNNNHLLAMLGDRDFSKNGVYTDFFGRKTLIPKGPAVFGYRIGSAIVPSFMIRQPDDTFKLFIEKPIFPEQNGDEENAIQSLTREYLPVIESYIKSYPTQWYMFREVWNNNDKKLLRPDTII